MLILILAVASLLWGAGVMFLFAKTGMATVVGFLMAVWGGFFIPSIIIPGDELALLAGMVLAFVGALVVRSVR